MERDRRYEITPESGRSRYSPFGARPGVERPDEDIRSDLLRAVLDDRRVDPADLLVTVSEGVVTLSGVVGTEEQRRAAEDDAFDILGVVDVHNELQTREE